MSPTRTERVVKRSARFAVVLFCLAAASERTPAELAPEQAKEAQGLIAQFTAAEFAVRQQAVEKLIALGPDVVPLVRKTLAETKDAEVKLRCEMVLKALERTVRAERTLVERTVKDLGASPPQNAAVFASSSGEGTAYLVQDGEKMVVYQNGVPGPEYDKGDAMYGRLEFSSDGRRLVYGARRGDKSFIVTDGVEGPAFDEVRSPRFWADDRKLSYIVKRDGKYCVMTDGRASPGYDVVGDLLKVSTDARHLYYEARRDDKAFVVIDGIEGPSHESVQLAYETPKPKYLVRDGETLWQVEADWPEEHPDRPGAIVEKRLKSLGKWWPEGPEGASRYPGGDFAGVCYVVQREGKRLVTFNGRQIGTYDDVWLVELSRDGGHLFFTAKRANRWLTVLDGKEGPAWDRILGAVFSRDGSRVGYVGQRDGKQFAVVDGKESPAWDAILSGDFSPDGLHTVYVGKRNGRFHVVLDGKESPSCDASTEVHFSTDSRHCWYTARRGGREFIVCDGLEGPGYSQIVSSRFSDDEKHLSYEARRGGRMCMVIDGVEGPPHVMVSLWPFLHGPWSIRAVRYFVTDDGRQTLVEVDWPRDLDWTNGLKPIEDEP